MSEVILEESFQENNISSQQQQKSFNKSQQESVQVQSHTQSNQQIQKLGSNVKDDIFRIKLRQYQIPEDIQTEYQDLLQVLQTYEKVNRSIFDVPEKIESAVEYGEIVRKKRYEITKEMLGNVHKRVEEYEKKQERLKNRIARNKTIKKYQIDNERFQEFSSILQADIQKFEKQLKKLKNKQQKYQEGRDLVRQNLDKQNLENLQLGNKISKLQKSLTRYENHRQELNKRSNYMYTQSLNNFKQDPLVKLENYCGSVLKEPKRQQQGPAKFIKTKNFKIKLANSNNQNNIINSQTIKQSLQQNSEILKQQQIDLLQTKSDFRKTFMKQTYYTKLQSEKSQRQYIGSSDSNFQNKLGQQARSSQKQRNQINSSLQNRNTKTTDGKLRTQSRYQSVHQNDIIQEKQESNLQSMNENVNNLKQQIKQMNDSKGKNNNNTGAFYLANTNENWQTIDKNYNSTFTSNFNQQNKNNNDNNNNQEKNIQQQQNQVVIFDEKQLKQEKKELTEDQQIKLMQEMDETIDQINEMKYKNSELKQKLFADVNYFFNCMELFEDCFETQIKSLEQNQKKVLNQNQGLQGSLLFEVNKTKTFLTDNKYEKKMKQIKPNIMSRQIQTCVYDTLKNMWNEKQLRKKPQQDLSLDWEQFKEYSLLQISGVMTLKPRVFTDIKWTYLRKSTQIKQILDQYKGVFNQIENI